MGGGIRLGPDVQFVDRNRWDYSVDESRKWNFYESVHRFLPEITPDDLYPDTAGVRPKLQGSGEDFRDFIIKDEEENGLPGLINLIGIDSPGLTASPAIAKHVRVIAERYL
jgi:L-2-hydroxyglutarate oxidase LhgO